MIHWRSNHNQLYHQTHDDDDDGIEEKIKSRCSSQRGFSPVCRKKVELLARAWVQHSIFFMIFLIFSGDLYPFVDINLLPDHECNAPSFLWFSWFSLDILLCFLYVFVARAWLQRSIFLWFPRFSMEILIPYLILFVARVWAQLSISWFWR